jgi:L-alanine-DL-glutamate epimerase-like enolase superfamily enzyme
MKGMPRPIRITRIRITHYHYTIADRAMDPIQRLDMLYQPGGTVSSGGRLSPGGDAILTIETDAGIVGEVPGAIDARAAHYLLGRDALARDPVWHELKRFYRGQGNAVPGAIDVALWDIAGKVYNAPIWELLGGWRTKVPAYASSFHGDDAGGLTRPEDFAEFALRCKEEYGYPAFKIHGWVNGLVSRDAAAIVAMRKAVGDEMDLMCDPAGAFRTFDEVLEVGYACDAAKYLWLEDPFPGGGLSLFAPMRLKSFIKTPLLTGEHLRGLEIKADMIRTGAADYVRAGPGADGGITGVMKLAALAEAYGMDVELHGGGIASRHCLAAIRNTHYYELGGVHPRLLRTKAPIYTERRWLDELDCVDANGQVDVPLGPGLGVQLDWEFINRHKTGQTVYE